MKYKTMNFINKITGFNTTILQENDNTYINNNQSTDRKQMIIGSSAARTGTSTLQHALNILGYNCYHFKELVKNKDFEIFIELGHEKQKIKKQKTLIDYNEWDTIFHDRGYTACVDDPTRLYYKELMGYYPNYKVIHCVRDAEKWYYSTRETVAEIVTIWSSRWLYKLLFSKINQCLLESIIKIEYDSHKKLTDPKYKDFMINRYNMWNREVINYVPKGRLLLFDFTKGHGWNELCQFLEIKQVPNIPFPRLNTREKWKRIIMTLNLVADVVNVGLVISMFGIVYYYRDSKVGIQIKQILSSLQFSK
eukprot:42343_1